MRTCKANLSKTNDDLHEIFSQNQNGIFEFPYKCDETLKLFTHSWFLSQFRPL